MWRRLIFGVLILWSWSQACGFKAWGATANRQHSGFFPSTWFCCFDTASRGENCLRNFNPDNSYKDVRSWCLSFDYPTSWMFWLVFSLPEQWQLFQQRYIGGAGVWYLGVPVASLHVASTLPFCPTCSFPSAKPFIWNSGNRYSGGRHRRRCHRRSPGIGWTHTVGSVQDWPHQKAARRTSVSCGPSVPPADRAVAAAWWTPSHEDPWKIQKYQPPDDWQRPSTFLLLIPETTWLCGGVVGRAWKSRTCLGQESRGASAEEELPADDKRSPPSH